MAPASGMGLSSEIGFGFGYTVRLWTFGLYIRESAADAGTRDSFGIVNFRESRGKSGSIVRSAGKSWKPRGGRRVCFPFNWPGVLTGEGETHME